MDAVHKEPDYVAEAELRNMIIELIRSESPTIPSIIHPQPDLLLDIGDMERPIAQLPTKPDIESTTLQQQKHISNGMAIYKDAVKRHTKAKTEADKLILAVKKLNKRSEFVVRQLDISLEDEDLGARLQEGTNRKRARSFSLKCCNHHNHLLDLISISAYDYDDERRIVRCHSEEVDPKPCARTRSLQFPGDTSASARTAEAGHNGDDMSERSSGTKRRLRSSSCLTVESPAKSLASANTSGTAEEEIANSAGQNEPVLIRGSSKRLRAYKVPQVVGKEAKEPETAVFPREETDALFTSNAHDEKKATTSSDAPKLRSWPFYARYQNPKINVFPDYGPRATIPEGAQHAEREMVCHSNIMVGIIVNFLQPIPGGPKPHNSLARPSQPKNNPTIRPHHSRTSLERPGLPKSFDLTGRDTSRSRGHDENPAKRQRSNDGSSRSPIDLEETWTRQSKHSEQASVRSGHSQTLQSRDTSASFGARDSNLQEIRKVDQTMKLPNLRQRKGAAMDKNPHMTLSVSNGHHRFAQQYVGEDENDRISDYGSSTKPGGSLSKRGETLTGWEGTSSQGPPRQAANGGSRIPSRGMETEEVSRHFRPNGGRAEKGLDQLSQGDQDELSVDTRGDVEHGKVTQKLPKHNRVVKGAFSKTRVPSFELEDSSEDDLSKKADIQPTKYGPTKANNQRKHDIESFQVHQVLSETMKWLLPAALSQWALEINKSMGTLSVIDASEQLVFQFPTKDVEKFEFANGNSLVVLHKSRAVNSVRDTKIFIEMHSYDDFQQLFQSLKSLHPTISRLPKETSKDYLKNCFRNIAEKQIPPKRPRTIAPEEPDDIRLARANEARRMKARMDTAQNTKKAGQGAYGTRQRNGSLENGPRSEGLAMKMRGRSDSNEFHEIDGHPRMSNAAATLLPGAFYGTYEILRANGVEGHGTRSSGKAIAPIDTSPSYRQSPRQQLRPRSSSPEPDRWTFANPDWVEKENWQTSVIYPPEGKNKASVDLQDIQRLDEGEFLNDNLIVFYLRWLEDHLAKDSPELASRIYFTNTFFYERLTKNVKGKSGGINYEAVERWTSKIDLLKYDYIVVPVNETVHWYVAIICNAPKLLKQPSSQEDASQPEKNRNPEDDSNKVELEEQAVSSPLKLPEEEGPDEVDVAVKELNLEESASKLPTPDTPETISDPSAAVDDLNTTQTVNLDSPIADIVSDVIDQKPSHLRQGKRKSLPPTRKYNPDDPRIITLDSLGLAHSPTCTNLKRYLMQEIKAKKNIEIEDPGALGTKAKNIPQQNNHCDCGLFLLTYIEEFLKKPDSFVSDILQQNDQDFTEWRSASDMRKHIRDLLFDLQRQQIAAADKSKKEKSKAKQAAKAADKSALASPSKPASREPTKSTHVSPSPGLGQDVVDSREPYHEKAEKRSEEPPRSVESSQQVGLGLSRKAEIPRSNEAELRDSEVHGVPRETPSLSTTLFGKVQSIINHALGSEMKPQPIVIDDSQDMDQDTQESATPSPVKKARKRKASRAPSPEDSREPKLSRASESIEIPESPSQEFAKMHSSAKESSHKMFMNPHPLLDSSQGEEEDHRQTSHFSERPPMNIEEFGRKLKAAKRFGSGYGAPELNAIETDNPITSSDVVNLIDPSPERAHNKLNLSRQQQDDDDDMLLPNDTTSPSAVAPQGPPNPRLLSSSPPSFSDVSVIEGPVKNQSRDKVAQSSPRSAKRVSSSAAEMESSSAKRRRHDVINLAGDSPKAKQKGPDTRFRDASDAAIMGERVLRRLPISKNSFV
ncbi:hypothetical protein WAI453_002639 [Rhynchosporium graminicola]